MLQTSLTWGNVWNYKEGLFVVDAEWMVFQGTWLYALRDDLQVSVTFPFSYRSGGVLDGLIEGFHMVVQLFILTSMPGIF